MTFLISAISSLELRRQRDRDRYARLTDEQKAQRNVRRRENYICSEESRNERTNSIYAG